VRRTGTRGARGFALGTLGAASLLVPALAGLILMAPVGTPAAAAQSIPVAPTMTLPSVDLPHLSRPAVLELDSLQKLDAAVNTLHEASWKLHYVLPNFRDVRGRTAAEDVDQWLLTPQHEAQLEALRATAQGESDKGDTKAMLATLKTAGELLEPEGYRTAVLEAYWSMQDVFSRHAANLRALAARLPPGPSSTADLVRSPEIELVATRVAKDLVDAMAADSEAARQLEGQRLRDGQGDLLRAYNDLRGRIAEELSKEERDQGTNPEAQPRTTPCPPAVTRTSGSGKPSIASDNQAPETFYPDAMRRGYFEGLVIIEASVSATGCAERAGVYQSSGVAALDDAALRWTEQAGFYPSERDHKAVDGVLQFGVKFQMAK
jgi:TonB family protein